MNLELLDAPSAVDPQALERAAGVAQPVVQKLYVRAAVDVQLSLLAESIALAPSLMVAALPQPAPSEKAVETRLEPHKYLSALRAATRQL